MKLETIIHKIRNWEREAELWDNKVEKSGKKEDFENQTEEFCWRPVNVTFHRADEQRKYVIHFPWKRQAVSAELVREPFAHRREERVDSYILEDSVEKHTAELLWPDDIMEPNYTLEDYYYVSEELRVELLDGRFYYMAAPTNRHQWLVYKLCEAFNQFIKTKDGHCISLPAANVQLNQDEKTMLEPDVFVVCDRDKLKKDRTIGAPDLVVEIHSPSTKSYDIKEKLSCYRQAGVREYWMVDPEKERVTVCDFGGEHANRIYGFHEKVPVGIFDGDCLVDLREILEELKEWEV